MVGQDDKTRGKHVSSSTDHRDPVYGCRDSQLRPVESSNRDDGPASCPPTFHRFAMLPWELRRRIWEHTLPRTVFRSARHRPTTCVPRPVISQVCQESRLVMNEFGSMVTVWELSSIVGPFTGDTTLKQIYTWYSPKLDTITLDPIDIKIYEQVGEAGQCDLFRLCKSPTTPLLVLENPSKQRARKPAIRRMYPEYLKGRKTVFLNIGDFQLIPKDEGWEIIMAEQMFGATGKSTNLIHLDDAAATSRYSKLWEHCCQDEKPTLAGHERLDFGAWLGMTTEEREQNDAHGWMKRYTAWKVEDHAFEEHLVTPRAYYLLQLADYIVDDPERGGSGPSRGHEIMDYNGKLKEGHPLIQQLDVQLPEVILVCTVRVLRRCRCTAGQTQEIPKVGS